MQRFMSLVCVCVCVLLRAQQLAVQHHHGFHRVGSTVRSLRDAAVPELRWAWLRF